MFLFFFSNSKMFFHQVKDVFFAPTQKRFFFSIAANCTEDASEDDTLGRFGINRPF
jgi:hypothetical protein